MIAQVMAMPNCEKSGSAILSTCPQENVKQPLQPIQ